MNGLREGLNINPRIQMRCVLPSLDGVEVQEWMK